MLHTCDCRIFRGGSVRQWQGHLSGWFGKGAGPGRERRWKTLQALCNNTSGLSFPNVSLTRCRTAWCLPVFLLSAMLPGSRSNGEKKGLKLWLPPSLKSGFPCDCQPLCQSIYWDVDESAMFWPNRLAFFSFALLQRERSESHSSVFIGVFFLLLWKHNRVGGGSLSVVVGGRWSS